MSLFERWKKQQKELKERRRKISEAVKVGLTPEQKLALLYNRPNSLWRIFPAVAIIGIFALAFASAIDTMDISYGLKHYFGENEWENIMAEGRLAVYPESSGDAGSLYWILGFCALVISVWGLFEICREFKTRTRLEREILTRLTEVKK